MLNLESITESDLGKNLESLCTKEREIISEVVAHLAELDRRGNYKAQGYSSLFSYCTEKLGYSEGAAMRRIKAARCLKDNPEIYQKLRAGKLTLCAISELSKVMTQENKTELLSVTEGQSKRAVEKIVAQLLPPVVSKKEAVRVKKVVVNGSGSLRDPSSSLVSPPPASELKYSLTLEVDQEFMQLLEKAKGYSGVAPTQEILKRTLRQFIERKVPKSRKASAPKVKVTRHIPAATRSRVFERDNHQCSYVGPTGKRCTETRHLQVDHLRPWALGGGHEVENLRLLCPGHNRFVAEEVFGKEKIQSKIIKQQ